MNKIIKFIKLVLILPFVTALTTSCKKEILDDHIDNDSKTKASINDLNRFATYNSTYDVLVFERFHNVAKLEVALANYSKNYPFDQNNTSTIFQLYERIKIDGYAYNKPPINNQVDLDDFEVLLLNSFPLSDSSLLGLLALNDTIALPDPFLTNILIDNIPFTQTVLSKIRMSNLNQTAIESIIEMNDDIYVVPDLAVNDFLRFYPQFNSLYKKQNIEEDSKLRNGEIPGSTNFYPSIVDNPFLSLVLNDKMEIYVEGHLIKLYSDCRTVVMQSEINNAYADLALLDEDGFVAPPDNVVENNTGISIIDMNTVFPMDYTLIDLNHIDFNPTNVNDPIGLNSLDSYEVVGCPQSSFTYGWQSSNVFEVAFTNLTNDYSGVSSIYHYWRFDDGTGSFSENPTHEFNAPGVYKVSLTTFSENCGCWDVQTLEVVIPDENVTGTKDCFCAMDVNVQGIINETNIVEFTADAYDDVDIYAYGVEYHWYFGDGTWEITSTPTVNHYYPYSGSYLVEVWVKMSNQCVTNVVESNIEIPNNDPNICCDKRQNLPSQTWTFSYNGTDNYKLKTNDSYTGNDLFGDKIYGCQKLYRKKDNGKWTGQKARHYINVNGEIYYKNLTTKEKCANVGIVSDFDYTVNKVAFDFACWQDPFGVLEQNSIKITHQVYVDYPQGYFIKVIHLGEQNCD